jgi:uncharacterized protein YcbX
MAKLTHIFIYPVKGLPGIELPESLVLPKGLQFDRRFMLVDEEGSFITQRQVNSLVSFQLQLNGDKLIITHPSKSEGIVLSLTPTDGVSIEVKVWGDLVLAIEPNATFSEWFSDCIHAQCKLVFMPEDTKRLLEQKFNRGEDTVSFADGYPFLLTNSASLAYLNAKLDEPIRMNRFRPNFVFDGAEAFEEDHIDEFYLGDLLFKATRACGRCKVITIDQASGEQGMEPLKTLQSFRANQNNVYFGENTMLLSSHTGKVHVGMELNVISYK